MIGAIVFTNKIAKNITDGAYGMVSGCALRRLVATPSHDNRYTCLDIHLAKNSTVRVINAGQSLITNN